MAADPLAIALVLMYAAMVGVALQQLRVLFIMRHKRLSYHMGVICLTIALGSSRVLFWAKTCSSAWWSEAFMMVLFMLPSWFQISAFLLLVLFYAQVALYTEWRSRYRPRCVALFAASSLLALGMTIAVAIEGVRDPEEDASKIDLMFRHHANLSSAALFLLLALALAVSGVLFHRVVAADRAHAPRLPLSLRAFATLNAALVVVFASRAAYNIASDRGLLSDRQVTIQFNGPHGNLYVGIFLIYVAWEVLPSTILLLLLWQAPRGNFSPALREDLLGPAPVGAASAAAAAAAATTPAKQPSAAALPQARAGAAARARPPAAAPARLPPATGAIRPVPKPATGLVDSVSPRDILQGYRPVPRSPETSLQRGPATPSRRSSGGGLPRASLRVSSSERLSALRDSGGDARAARSASPERHSLLGGVGGVANSA